MDVLHVDAVGHLIAPDSTSYVITSEQDHYGQERNASDEFLNEELEELLALLASGSRTAETIE